MLAVAQPGLVHDRKRHAVATRAGDDIGLVSDMLMEMIKIWTSKETGEVLNKPDKPLVIKDNSHFNLPQILEILMWFVNNLLAKLMLM